MALKVECENCGYKIHKVWDTLSIYQTITDGGIVECKNCKTRYKSKYKTSFFNGYVRLSSSIFFILFIIFMLNDFSFPFSFEQEPAPDVKTMYKKLTGIELEKPNFFSPTEQDKWNKFGAKLLTDDTKFYKEILTTILAMICFVAIFNILNVIAIFFIPLRRISADKGDRGIINEVYTYNNIKSKPSKESQCYLW
ncbi:hypothetical protein CQA53_11150 [Helicobacter didelphidarum]|uniref:Uncharacterized protein n=1 Tax=Helicobacter didelphidarum TaxID=2040648 RepID=A0A3D8I489_9HELI|nr:hypothetical protein [Helicobacter didelphidarum]RDU59973.1 hypothetical protein CQA53_11150 [Helicobacter didelphidarum]